MRLQKVLKSHHILAVAIGGTISSSYFLGNGYVLSQVGPFAFLTFILGGLITYLTMECLAELVTSEAVPKHTSFVSYAKEFISATWACGVGWAYWVNWVLYISVELIAAGILLNAMIPDVSIYLWSMICCILVIATNLAHVKIFGTTSFWLTFTHLTLFFGFSILALFIYFGVFGTNHEFLGTKYLLSDGPFPKGVAPLFINMVIMLLNFQGTEIIGLTASEAHQPKKVIGQTMRKIALSVTALYITPIFLLALIYPWQQATLSESVFAAALADYGFTFFGKIFTIFVVAGSLSCANSGLYAAVRSVHALTKMGMCPMWLEKLNRFGMPSRIVWITAVVPLILLQIGFFRPYHDVYITYLTLAGCIGATIWVSICVCQYLYRRRLSTSQIKALPHKIPGFPYITLFAIAIQCVCLLLSLGNPDLRASFFIGIPAFAIPMIWYTLRKRLTMY